jgi:hypothetical protein
MAAVSSDSPAVPNAVRTTGSTRAETFAQVNVPFF